MSDMLGRTNPWEHRCCTRHGGRYRKSGKRRNEARQWRKDVDDERLAVGIAPGIRDARTRGCPEVDRGA